MALALLSQFGPLLLGLLGQLVTAVFLRRVVVIGLEAVKNHISNEAGKQLVDAIEQAVAAEPAPK